MDDKMARHLVRDYEKHIDVSKAMIFVAMGGISSDETPIHEFQNRLSVLMGLMRTIADRQDLC
jgi:hypothetical protein